MKETSTSPDIFGMDIKELQKQIVSEIREGRSLLGKGGLLTPLLKSALEATLEGELEDHLEQTRGNKNRRNGKMAKMMSHSAGSFELETPRDRDGSFEPEIVRKRQTVLNDTLDNKILRLYSLGMSLLCTQKIG